MDPTGWAAVATLAAAVWLLMILYWILFNVELYRVVVG